MSIVAELQDQRALEDAIKDVRNDSSPINWVIASHIDGNPTLVGLLNKGTGGPQEMVENLKDDEAMYALVRLEEEIDMSMSIKFVYVHWIGDRVPFTKRGKYGVVHGSIQLWFNPSHCNIATGSKEDLTYEEMMSLLNETSGTKSKVMEVADATSRQDRGFTSSSNIIKTGKTQSAVKNPEAVGVSIDDSVTAALRDVRDDQTPTCWCAAAYEDDDPKKPIILVASGTEGSSVLSSVCTNDKVVYALLRVTDVVDDISTVKFVFIQWLGDNVKPMTKAKISAHKSTVEKVFNPAHATIFATNADELSENEIMDKVKSASGSKSHVK